jgi:hypothetical protein
VRVYNYEVDGGSPGGGTAVVIASDGRRARAAAKGYAKMYSIGSYTTYTIGKLRSVRDLKTYTVEGQCAEVLHFDPGEN